MRDKSMCVIITTEDVLNLCLVRYLKVYNARKYLIFPLGVCVTLVTVRLLNTFCNMHLENLWKAMFIGCLLWLSHSLIKAILVKPVEFVHLVTKFSGRYYMKNIDDLQIDHSVAYEKDK